MNAFMRIRRSANLEDGQTDGSRHLPEDPYSSDITNLPAFPTDPNFGAPPSDAYSDYDLVGYDCTKPRGRKAVQMQKESTFCTRKSEPAHQRNATFSLLQKVNLLPMKIRQCSVTESLQPYYCGFMSHNVFNSQLWQTDEKVLVKPEECEELWRTLKYVDPTGQTFNLYRETTTSIYYQVCGVIDNESAECWGDDYVYKGKKYEDMVVTANRKIVLWEHEANVDDDGIIHIPHKDLTLPCTAKEKYCTTANSGTWVWNELSAKNQC